MGIFSQANKKEEKKLPFGTRKSKGAFGSKKSKVKARSSKMSKEKDELSNDYYSYLHSSNQKCVVCGSNSIEIHHITDIKRIPGKRRVWNRVITLCPEHHKNSKEAIHALSKDAFYDKIMSFEKLMEHSDRLYCEYLDTKKML